MEEQIPAVRAFVDKNEVDWQAVGKAFLEIRSNLGFSTYQASELTGISKSHIWTIEQGRGCSMSAFMRLYTAYKKTDKTIDIWEVLKKSGKVKV